MELFGIFERFAVQPPQSGLLHFGRLLLVPGGYTTVPTIQISHDMLCAGFYVCGVAFFSVSCGRAFFDGGGMFELHLKKLPSLVLASPRCLHIETHDKEQH